MADQSAEQHPGEPLICSRQGCREQAVWGLLWNNPRIHAPQRRKVWLACDAHREYLADYLSVRGFLKDVEPVTELPPDIG